MWGVWRLGLGVRNRACGRPGRGWVAWLAAAVWLAGVAGMPSVLGRPARAQNDSAASGSRGTKSTDAKARAMVVAAKTGRKTAGKAAAPALRAAADAAIDIGDARDKLIVLHDGKQHYVAVIPFGPYNEHLYYGDGKIFWSQRVSNGGSSGTEYMSRTFWEPRAQNLSDAMLTLRDGRYSVECDARKTELQPLPDGERKALLAAAKFYPPRWKYQAYALTRDDSGRYFYVDQALDPEQRQRFRLFAGTKGNLKPQKMVNVVSDSAGDIFATKSGSLHLVLDKNESSWNEGPRKTPLIVLPLADNHVLIYADLGVYAGEHLGTPCDDL